MKCEANVGNSPDELLGKVVCVDYISLDKKKALWFPALVSNFSIRV